MYMQVPLFRWLLISIIEHSYLIKVEGIKFTVADLGDEPRQKPFAYKLSEKWLKQISGTPISDPNLIRRNTLTAKYVEVRIKVGEEKRIVEPSAEELKKHGGMKLATDPSNRPASTPP